MQAVVDRNMQISAAQIFKTKIVATVAIKHIFLTSDHHNFLYATHVLKNFDFPFAMGTFSSATSVSSRTRSVLHLIRSARVCTLPTYKIVPENERHTSPLVFLLGTVTKQINTRIVIAANKTFVLLKEKRVLLHPGLYQIPKSPKILLFPFFQAPIGVVSATNLDLTTIQVILLRAIVVAENTTFVPRKSGQEKPVLCLI